jgi:hypothetical protein
MLRRTFKTTIQRGGGERARSLLKTAIQRDRREGRD